MSKYDSDWTFGTSAEPKNQPVVCIIPSLKQKPEELIRAIMRAQTGGHHVMVAKSWATTGKMATYAKQLGATVIDANDGRTNGASLQSEVARQAKDVGVPGAILHQNPAKRVDYDASRQALQETDEYVIDAVCESAIDTDPTVLVGIPAYNEVDQIDRVVIEASAHADEVLVIDDGSTDATSQVAADAGATVVKHNNNRGYGQALQSIFLEAARSGTDYLVVLDGDGQHNPEDILRLVEAQCDGEADIVIGNRFGSGADTDLPLYRRFGLAVVNLLTNLSLGAVRPQSRVTDTQSGFRAYNKRAINSLAETASISHHMGASTDILHHAHKNNLQLAEVGTTVEYDIDGTSNHNPISHGITLLNNLLLTIEQQRPISSLGVPGFASTLVGIGFAYWTIVNYVSTGSLSLELAVGSVFFTLAGIFACFTAIILHALNQSR